MRTCRNDEPLSHAAGRTGEASRRMRPRFSAPGIACAAALLLFAQGWALTAGEPSPPARGASAGRSDRSDAVQCANLIYAGTRTSVCFSDKFLAAVARDSTINTARKFKPVKLAGAELFDYPFAIMTGEGAFSLTEAERTNLRRYLERGGFLLASAGCSSKQWDTSFRREMETVFPERTLETLPRDHEIFRTIYPVKSLKTKGPEAELTGLTLGGKVVLIYSEDGLNDTNTMHGCCCCGGNEIRNAQKVNANILAYALLQ